MYLCGMLYWYYSVIVITWAIACYFLSMLKFQFTKSNQHHIISTKLHSSVYHNMVQQYTMSCIIKSGHDHVLSNVLHNMGDEWLNS